MPTAPATDTLWCTHLVRTDLQVTEAQVLCSDNGRDAALYFLLACHPGRTLVFVNAVSALRRLVALLKILQLPVRALHAGLQQRQRLKALQGFRSNPQAILVASDVAARGLDIPVGIWTLIVMHSLIAVRQKGRDLVWWIHICDRTNMQSAQGLHAQECSSFRLGDCPPCDESSLSQQCKQLA